MNAALTALVLLCALAMNAHADTRIRVTNGEWAPYLSENLPHFGLASRIISEAFALEGVTVQYGFFPWKRSLDMARDGDWDAAAVWHRSEEREKDFYVSEPVVVSRYVFFHRVEQRFDWTTLEDLRGYRIGATLAYDYGKEFTRAEELKRIQVERVARDELNFGKLLAHRIDLFPMDQVVGMDMLYRNHSAAERSRLSFHPLPLRADGLHLLLSRKVAGNEALLQRFNRGLKRLHESGLVAQYVQEFEATLASQGQ